MAAIAAGIAEQEVFVLHSSGVDWDSGLPAAEGPLGAAAAVDSAGAMDAGAGVPRASRALKARVSTSPRYGAIWCRVGIKGEIGGWLWWAAAWHGQRPLTGKHKAQIKQEVAITTQKHCTL